MKIAYIAQAYPPMISGAAIVVERLAASMSARGHSTLVLAASDKGPSYTTQKDGVRIVRLHSIPNPKRAYQYFTPGSFRSIDRELRVFQPDIIHIHDLLSLGVAGIFAGRITKTPVIATVHALPWFISAYLPPIPGIRPSVETVLWLYSRWLNEQCERMIVPTSTTSQTIAAKGGFQTTEISNGVDLECFSPVPTHPRESEQLRDRLGLDPAKPIILHVGRLDIDKRVDIAILAAANAMRQCDAQLLIVGDGERRESLIELTTELGIRDRSFFPGFMHPQEEIPGVYRMASVFITTSEIETQGLVLLEALASELPAVAVDATCIHEIIKNNHNGFLVPPGDADVAGDKLLELLRYPSQARRMGAAGRIIAQNHSVTISLNKYESLYKGTINAYATDRQRKLAFTKRAANEKISRFYHDLLDQFGQSKS
jgi:1,2-diacylglycerol 3-alpha-glucosyltransferase